MLVLMTGISVSKSARQRKQIDTLSAPSLQPRYLEDVSSQISELYFTGSKWAEIIHDRNRARSEIQTIITVDISHPNSPANDTTLRSDELELGRNGSRVLAARRLPLPLPASDRAVLLPAEEPSLRPRRPQGAGST